MRASIAMLRARRSSRILKRRACLARHQGSHEQRGPLRPLQDGRRAASLAAMVRQDSTAGRQGHRRGEEKAHDPVHAGDVREDLPELDGEHPRLVHLAPALVGASHSRVALCACATRSRWRARIRRNARIADRTRSRRRPTCWTRGSRRACCRFRSSAGRILRPKIAPTSTPFIRPACWSPASTFSSSGWRG